MTKSCALFKLTLALLLVVALPAAAIEVEVTIENLAPENGSFLTPVWVGFHNGEFDSYDNGAAIRESIERIAEDGNTGPLTEEFDLAFGTPQGTIVGPNGPIAPGETARMIFDLDSSAAVRYFSYVSMIIPSNDAFIANGGGTEHRVFDLEGDFTPFSFVVAGGGNINDGGTEVNDEIPANTAFFGQMAPNTGVDENGVVTRFQGFMPPGSGGILDDPRFMGARTQMPGYDIARITVRAVRNTTFSFNAYGGQEVPPVDTMATAACEGTLSLDETTISFSCEHNVENVVAAHIHEAPRGENGPVIFLFDDPSSPFSQSFPATEENVATLLGGNFYVNIHSEAYPAGEIRGQLDGCFASPTTLCLNNERFQVSANWETADDNGVAKGFELTPDSGVLYFFRASNIELDVKVLNGCNSTGNYWVFAAGLTNQGVELTVIDTDNGQRQSYTNPLGTDFQPILDTRAFATCP